MRGWAARGWQARAWPAQVWQALAGDSEATLRRAANLLADLAGQALAWRERGGRTAVCASAAHPIGSEQQSKGGGVRGIVLVILALAAACSNSSSQPPQVCTQIGCESGLQVELGGAPAGPFRVEAQAAGGGAARVFECPAGQRCEFAFFSDFTPEEATIRVIADGRTTARTVRPTYGRVQPNGPGCPPICRQGRVRVEVGNP